jgi:small subunit ribosomal protein S6
MEETDRKELYETVIICNPDKYKHSVDTVEEICQEFTGKKYKIKVDRMGIKKLAYEIHDRTTAYYTIFTWSGTRENVTELERILRIDDDVLKFMTLKLDEEENSLEEISESEQQSPIHPEENNSQIDALDVLLGLADYTRTDKEDK